MTHTVEAEIEDREIVQCVRGDPDLLLSILIALRNDEKPGTASRTMYAEALRVLGAAEPDDMDPAAWADAYFRMDRIDRDRAMQELHRVCPGDIR